MMGIFRKLSGASSRESPEEKWALVVKKVSEGKVRIRNHDVENGIQLFIEADQACANKNQRLLLFGFQSSPDIPGGLAGYASAIALMDNDVETAYRILIYIEKCFFGDDYSLCDEWYDTFKTAVKINRLDIAQTARMRIFSTARGRARYSPEELDDYWKSH
jgi:hypothetical protein